MFDEHIMFIKKQHLFFSFFVVDTWEESNGRRLNPKGSFLLFLFMPPFCFCFPADIGRAASSTCFLAHARTKLFGNFRAGKFCYSTPWVFLFTRHRLSVISIPAMSWRKVLGAADLGAAFLAIVNLQNRPCGAFFACRQLSEIYFPLCLSLHQLNICSYLGATSYTPQNHTTKSQVGIRKLIKNK